MKTRSSLRGKNRCVKCNRFRNWLDLHMFEFTPDTPFTREDAEYMCMDCIEHYEDNMEDPNKE